MLKFFLFLSAEVRAARERALSGEEALGPLSRRVRPPPAAEAQPSPKVGSAITVAGGRLRAGSATLRRGSGRGGDLTAASGRAPRARSGTEGTPWLEPPWTVTRGRSAGKGTFSLRAPCSRPVPCVEIPVLGWCRLPSSPFSFATAAWPDAVETRPLLGVGVECFAVESSATELFGLPAPSFPVQSKSFWCC